MEELKKCPFCDGKVRLNKFNIADIYGIYCPKCGTCYSNSKNESKETVIKAWNKRAGD